MTANTKAALQSAEYRRPYHWIPGPEGSSWTWDYGPEYLIYTREVERIVRGLSAHHEILDVGCGDGRFLDRFSGWTRLGIDLDPEAIKWRDGFGLPIVNLPAEEIQGKYEIVTAIEVLEHIPPEKAGEFLRTLGGIGRWIVLTVPSDRVPVSPKHYRHFSEESLREVLTSSGAFHLIHIYGSVRKARWFEWSNRILRNSRWVVEIPRLNRWLHKLGRRLDRGSPEDCKHLVAVCRGRGK